MADDFEGMSVFLAVAEALNFRVAGERLGVTRSAVSQALQRLEDRIGVALVQRTTRSVRLTEAGELLYDLVKPPARDLSDAAIEHYLQAEQPYDCAGSAKSEGLGIALLNSIDSDDPTADARSAAEGAYPSRAAASSTRCRVSAGIFWCGVSLRT